MINLHSSIGRESRKVKLHFRHVSRFPDPLLYNRPRLTLSFYHIDHVDTSGVITYDSMYSVDTCTVYIHTCHIGSYTMYACQYDSVANAVPDINGFNNCQFDMIRLSSSAILACIANPVPDNMAGYTM